METFENVRYVDSENVEGLFDYAKITDYSCRLLMIENYIYHSLWRQAPIDFTDILFGRALNHVMQDVVAEYEKDMNVKVSESEELSARWRVCQDIYMSAEERYKRYH